MKFYWLWNSLPSLCVHLIGETYKKVLLERLKEYGQVQVRLVIVAEEENELDIRALLSKLNGLMKKGIICTGDSEESA